MSNSPETEFNLELHFLPAWAQQSPGTNRYANYAGETAQTRDHRRERGRPPGGPQRGGENRRPREGGFRPAGGPRPPGGRRPSGGGGREERGHFRDRREGGDQPKPLPLPQLDVNFVPDDFGVESLAKQIRMTGRAYPLFEIAQMVLKRPERHLVKLAVKKNAEGKAVQPLFVCALDDSPWLFEEEAVQHVLEKHFDTFYQTQRTKTEPPKGTYTFVAQCGMSGVILGPPNHHDYQNQLRKLHAERFSRMPFDAFKARVKIVRDEAVVKKWLDDQSYKTDYLCLNMPEPLQLGTREAVEKHFRETHQPTIIRQVDHHEFSGSVGQKLRCPALQRLVRVSYEQQRRFPLQIATVLSHQFAQQGLQFFKVNKTVTHVAVARPHFLDLDASPVSDTVRRIVVHINAHPKCSRRQLVEALAPTPLAPTAPAPVVPVDGGAPQAEAGQKQAGAESSADPTPEQTAIIADLHWLIHQGHVIEFADGLLDTAKKPLPKPVRLPKVKEPSAPATDTKAPSPTSSTEVAAEEFVSSAAPTPESSVSAEPEVHPISEELAQEGKADQASSA